jgi:hypothetical protein
VPSKAFATFESKLASDVSVLRDIVNELTGSAPGKREQRLKVLHRSSIVLLSAAFESYCESVLLEATEALSAFCTSPSMLPKELLRNIAIQKGIAKNKSELFPWNFAADRWRDLAVNYATHRTEQLNTPNSSNIRELFKDLLGIEDICSLWGRKNMTAERACIALDELIEQRGSIAHGGESSDVVLSDVERFENFLRQTVSMTDDVIESMLKSALAETAWIGF